MANTIDDQLINEILGYVKLQLTSTIDDNLLIYYIKAICNNVAIYTNRIKFPDALKYVIVDLVRDKFNTNNKDTKDLQAIQSMSEAGRNVNFGIDSVTQAKLNLIAQKQIEANQTLLNRYKLLYKVGDSNAEN